MGQGQYEGVFILDPDQKKDDTGNVLVGTVEKLIADHGGTITQRQIWGRRRLTYPIRKRHDGFYYLVWFDLAPHAVVTLQRVLRLHEGILRAFVTAVVRPSPGAGKPADGTPVATGSAAESQEPQGAPR